MERDSAPPHLPRAPFCPAPPSLEGKGRGANRFMQTRLAIRKVDARLEKLYGEPERRRRDPVAQLVATMLSQATTDIQTARSFDNLRRRYRTWEEVRNAPAREIAKEIRASGLSRQKAPRIKAALEQIRRERGRIELRFLKRMSDEEAFRWLTQIKGVGPKTASIVLLFAMGRPFFPVDTHVFRVTKRLGWIPARETYEQAHRSLRELIPPRLYYRLHLNLIRLGREICLARRPRCEVCPLKDLCPYYQEAVALSAT